MAIKGKLEIMEYPQAEVYKFIAVFDTEQYGKLLGYGETEEDALSKLASKIEFTHNSEK